jgi:hypothetical protein
MPEELKPGCARPTGGRVGESVAHENAFQEERKEESQVILIGKKGPDFTARAYHKVRRADRARTGGRQGRAGAIQAACERRRGGLFCQWVGVIHDRWLSLIS